MKEFAKCKGVWYRNTQSAARGILAFCLFFLFNQVDSSSHAGMQKFMALARSAVEKRSLASERERKSERERERERGRGREWKNDYNSNELQLERPKFDNGCCYWLRSLTERRSLSLFRENKRIWANDSRSAFHFPTPASQHIVLTIYLRTTRTMITIHMAMTRAMYSLTRQPPRRSVFHGKGCRRLSSARCVTPTD